MKQKAIFNLSVIALFAIAVLLDRYFSWEFLKFFPGVLMLYYLPGNSLNDLLLRRFKQMSWSTKFALDIGSSIAVVYLAYSFFKGSLGYAESQSIIFIVALNLILFGLNFLVSLRDRQQPVQGFSLNKENKHMLLLALIPIALFGLRLIFNPYIYEIDALQYFNIYNHILARGFDDSWLTGQRNGFALFMVYTKYITDMGFIGFSKFFTPIIFYLTSMVLLDFVREIKNKHLALLMYLLLIASPMLIIMTEDVRPETFLILFTLPTFYLLYLSIKEKSWVLALMALAYSYVSFRFHDLGSFLLLGSFLTIGTLIVKGRREIISLVNSNRKLALIILVPYLIVLAQNLHKLSVFFSGEIFQGVWNMTVNMTTHPQWRWWFLDHFTDIDDGVIAWPGWSALLYYLYSGLNVILFFIIACMIYVKAQRSSANVKKVSLLPLLPIALFLVIYLAIAEFFPRMGLFLFPNRTWPHIMLAMVFIIVVLFFNIRQSMIFKSKLLLLALWGVFLSGLVGVMIGTVYMGGAVWPGEKGVIAKIRSLPPGSVIVSAQLNGNVATLYGGKTFLKIEPVSFEGKAVFLEKINSAVNGAPIQSKKALLSTVGIQESRTLTISWGTNLTSAILDNTITSDVDDKITILQKYNPKMYEFLEGEIANVNQIPKQPVYFLYSFDRFRGVLATRDWWVEDNDPENLEILKNYSGDDVVYKDDHNLLIKIRDASE